MSWITSPLGEVTTVLSGSTPDSSNPAYWGGNNVWITPTDLGKLSTRIIDSSLRQITNTGRSTCNLPLIPKGAVVMSSRAPIGHLAIAGCDLYTNQGCKSFICSTALDATFLYFALKYRMPDIQAMGSGATFVEVSKSSLEAFEISFPEEIDEQLKIVAGLKSQMAEVAKARDSVAVQLQDAAILKSQAMESVFATVPTRKKIGTTAKVQSGYAFKSESFQRNGIRLLRNTNILPGMVYWDDAVCLSEAEAGSFSSYELHEGDVLISLDRPIISSGIKVARVRSVDLPALLLQRVGRFLIDPSQLDADYLYAYLQTQLFVSAISGHDQSVGVPHISPTQVEEVEMPLPEVSVQKDLSKRLNAIMREWNVIQTAIQAQLDDLSVLPQAILAQAFGN